MSNPYQVVRDFESAICEYTGAPYAVAVNSCTMALAISLYYKRRSEGWAMVSIPKRTYCSVPQVIKMTGHRIEYRDEEWIGAYELEPFNVIDSARYFSSGMYKSESMMCCSFHASKILNDTQGGCVLHDNPDADKFLRKARFDGRTEGVAPKDDHFDMLGYHCYMSPDVAARLLLKLHSLPKYNPPLPNDDYPDLSKFEVFHG